MSRPPASPANIISRYTPPSKRLYFIPYRHNFKTPTWKGLLFSNKITSRFFYFSFSLIFFVCIFMNFSVYVSLFGAYTSIFCLSREYMYFASSCQILFLPLFILDFCLYVIYLVDYCTFLFIFEYFPIYCQGISMGIYMLSTKSRLNKMVWIKKKTCFCFVQSEEMAFIFLTKLYIKQACGREPKLGKIGQKCINFLSLAQAILCGIHKNRGDSGFYSNT